MIGKIHYEKCSKFQFYMYRLECYLDYLNPKRYYRQYLDNKYMDQFNIGDVVETCSYHVGMIININRQDQTIIVKSLMSGREECCSIFHCGVWKPDAEYVYKILSTYNEKGIDGVLDFHDTKGVMEIFNGKSNNIGNY